MTDEPWKPSLSQIDTRWSLILEAHQGQGDTATRARSELMIRYSGAVHRYLLRLTRDPDLASDLSQEFALRFLRGDFHRVDPRRGRFRDYVKTSILNLLTDFHRKRKNQPRPLPDDGAALPETSNDRSELDRQFLDCWRDEILSRAWDRLSLFQEQTGRPLFTVLRFRADHPDLRSHEMAVRLTEPLGKTVTAGWVRQNLVRARERFVEFVNAEVAHSLGSPTSEELDQELTDLGLRTYSRPAPGSSQGPASTDRNSSEQST